MWKHKHLWLFGGGGSLIRLGPYWFTSTLYLYLFTCHIWKQSLIRTSWVKIQNMKKIPFLGGPGGPYIKSRGTGDTKMSTNSDLIKVETYVHTGKQLKTSFFIYGPKGVFFHIFCNLRGPGGHSIIRLGLSCSPAILSPISMYVFGGSWPVRPHHRPDKSIAHAVYIP